MLWGLYTTWSCPIGWSQRMFARCGPGLPRVSHGLVPGRNGPRRLHHVAWPAQRHRRRPGAHRRGTTALPRPRIRLGVSRYATRVAHIRPDDGARRETISVGSYRRLPSCFGDLARVRHQEEQAATEVFPSGTAKPPYPTTSTVVYYRSHWTVQRVNTDVTRTCSGGEGVLARATCASRRAFPCPVREFSLGAGDGNRTRTISLEG